MKKGSNFYTLSATMDRISCQHFNLGPDQHMLQAESWHNTVFFQTLGTRGIIIIKTRTKQKPRCLFL